MPNRQKTTEIRKTASFQYQLIRTGRRTMALTVKEDGSLMVRGPLKTAGVRADAFVEGHRDWIKSRRETILELQKERPTYTEEERNAGIKRAGEVLSARCSYFSDRMGVVYKSISVREQKTRWGSCSAKGNLSFHWKLVLMPPEILDYLVVHELAHRKEMNHSERFWAAVEQEIPDYRERRAWLKENGARY